MKKIIPIFVPHQGCPRRCIFCHQPYITGVALNTPISPPEVRRQIDRALHEPKSRKKGVTFDAAFYGGTFTGLPFHLQKDLLCAVQPYVDCGQLGGIHISTHPALFDEQIFALLQRFSVNVVELGVQSFDDEVLRQARRGHTASGAIQTIHKLQVRGIAVGIHLMIGLPGDSHEKALRSAHTTIELRPASVRIHPTLIIRGTELETRYQQGTYVPLFLDEAVHTCKDLLRLFQQHSIPVIRIGLQPTDSMEQHILAGPYHPAFRQIVESALWYETMAALCAAQPCHKNAAVIYVAPKTLSTARGQKNSNLRKLRQQFPLQNVQILPDEHLQRHEIRIGQGAIVKYYDPMLVFPAC